MKTSLLNLDLLAEPAAVSTGRPQGSAAAASEPRDAEPKTADDESIEFEIVLGRRQLASTGLVLIVVVACFAGISYLIGKSSALSKDGFKTGAASSSASDPAPASPASASTNAVKPSPATAFSVGAPNDQGPVFAEAVAGSVYIQVGAIDKGLAGIWAEGLRAHGLDAFVSPGLSDKMWRVLIGPLPDPQSYQRAKEIMDNLGISTFGRRVMQDASGH